MLHSIRNASMMTCASSTPAVLSSCSHRMRSRFLKRNSRRAGRTGEIARTASARIVTASFAVTVGTSASEVSICRNPSCPQPRDNRRRMGEGHLAVGGSPTEDAPVGPAASYDSALFGGMTPLEVGGRPRLGKPVDSRVRLSRNSNAGMSTGPPYMSAPGTPGATSATDGHPRQPEALVAKQPRESRHGCLSSRLSPVPERQAIDLDDQEPPSGGQFAHRGAPASRSADPAQHHQRAGHRSCPGGLRRRSRACEASRMPEPGRTSAWCCRPLMTNRTTAARLASVSAAAGPHRRARYPPAA
jgi:hypothetical protein